jgi:hypothetical protein
MNWEWSNLIDVSVSDGQIAISVGPVVWLSAIGLAVLWILIQRPWYRFPLGWRVVEINPTFFNTQWRIVRNTATAQLAHEAYVELVTRKAALKIEEEDDVFTELYDSWYALFGEIRRLARKLDADEVSRNADLRRLHELLVDVLNRGLRPHLTRWQSRFRRWYEEESRKRPSESAQDIQRSYPEYPQLVASLKEANHLLINLARELRRLAYGDVSS